MADQKVNNGDSDLPEKITTKEVIEQLRRIAEKQKISAQKTVMMSEKGRKQIAKESCKICGNAVIGIMNNSKNMADDIMTLKDMYRSGLYQMRIGGLIYTRDDIEARINTSKCFIEKNLDRYNRCCKEGKLPIDEKIRC